MNPFTNLWMKYKESIRTVAKTIGLVLGLIYSGGLVYAFYLSFHTVPTKVTWYEQLGVYTPKLTIETWNDRLTGWSTAEVKDCLGEPLREQDGSYGNFVWEYKLPLKSSHDSTVVTTKPIKST